MLTAIKSCGFLPATDPLDRLPSPFDAWENVAHALPKLLMTDQIKAIIEGLPEFPRHEVKTDAERQRAMLILCYIGHAYVWSGVKPATRVPAILARPWCEIARQCGRPPVLSYQSYALDNWRRIDPNRPPEIGNIALLQNFLAGEDEEWFILIHVDIEHQATPGLTHLPMAQEAALAGDADATFTHLRAISTSLENMFASMVRMTERCDPYIYYRRVRPYIHGWKNHPDLPQGLIYEGEFDGQPQQFRGETGAQSSIIPAMDAVLGVFHEEDVMKTYLMEMRTYMPPAHRAFIESLEARASVREFCMAGSPELREAYDTAVDWVQRFRTLHLEYAALYIFKQQETDAKNPHDVGTGGTPFMRYLKKHRDETREHLLKPHEFPVTAAD